MFLLFIILDVLQYLLFIVWHLILEDFWKSFKENIQKYAYSKQYNDNFFLSQIKLYTD